MKTASQFYVGQIVTLKSMYLKPAARDLPLGGLKGLLDKIRALPEVYGGPISTELYIPAEVRAISDSFDMSGTSRNISVRWLNPFRTNESLGLDYTVYESDFMEFVDPQVFNTRLTGGTTMHSVTIGHTHVAPGSYTHGYDFGTKIDPYTFEEINPEINVSFKSKKLIPNKINNSKEIENFLLIN